VNLKSGDMVYFEDSLATAVLLYKRDDLWVYSLRSPPKYDLTHFVVSVQFDKETDFVKAIKSGRFQHYEAR
jgi:hypothetical protein